MTRSTPVALLAAALAACTSPLPAFEDGGASSDAGAMDGGAPEDAGGGDAGERDAGDDAGDGTDAGPFDGGPPDAGAPPGVEQVAVGRGFSCVRLTGGEVQCWGGDDRAQLGDGFTTSSFEGDRPEPEPVVGVTNAASIHPSFGATCAIDATDGSVLCWGNNNAERFGDGIGPSETPTAEALQFEVSPEPLVGLSHNGSHLCARSAERVYCSGRNNLHQLGRETENTPFLGPVAGLPADRAPRSVAVGYSSTQGFTLVALDDGTVWCFGANDDGECAQPASTSVDVPTQITELSRIVQVAAGNDYACALDETGAVFCWGNNRDGRLGLGTVDGPDVVTPTEVTLPTTIGEVVTGQTTALAISADRRSVYGWGDNFYGQLGLGTRDDESGTPRPIFAGGAATYQVALAAGHACALRREGGEATVLCAGDNGQFQLGTRTPADPTTFAPVPAFE